MLLFFIRKVKGKKPKIICIFEPDRNFKSEFGNFVREVLNLAKQKETKPRIEKIRRNLEKVKLK